MSWRLLARRDALDPVRSKSIWSVLFLFVVLFGLLGYAGSVRPEAPLAPALTGVVYSFVPLVGLTVAYGRIAGRRESGELRHLLAHPHTRRELVVGTVLGRVAVLATVLAAGFLAAALAFLVFVGVPALLDLALAWGLALALGAVSVGLGVGISAAVGTSNRAVVLTFGAFLLLLVLWNSIPSLALQALNGFQPLTGPPPEWAVGFRYLNPIQAYRVAAGRLLADAPAAEAFYRTLPFAGLVLFAWFVGPLLAGLRRFEAADL